MIDISISPAVRELIISLDPTREYAITRDLVAHRITRAGHTVPGGPIVFYDYETRREVGLRFGGRGNFIRVSTDDVQALRAAVRDGRSPHHDIRAKIQSLNSAADAADA